MEEENRDRIRVELKNLVLARVGEEFEGGVIGDISSGGTSVEFVYPPGGGEHGFDAGDSVELDIDGIGVIKGKIVRLIDKGIAVEFDMNSDREDELIAKIMAAINEIPADE